MKPLAQNTVQNSDGAIWFTAGSLLLIAVSILDFITGADFSFSLFYLLPIAIFSLNPKKKYGIVAAILSAVIWFSIEISSNTHQNNVLLHFWNAIIRLGFFFLPVLFIKSIERERRQARTDYLTNTFNNRHFSEMLDIEVNRSARHQHTLTVAFIDTDNFKLVNDTFGHSFGDTTLKSIAEIMQNSLRKTDIVARIGGDEFAILMPETGEQAARAAISNMVKKLAEGMHHKKTTHHVQHRRAERDLPANFVRPDFGDCG